MDLLSVLLGFQLGMFFVAGLMLIEERINNK